MVSSINSVEEEVLSQPDTLDKEIRRPVPERLAPGTVIVGAGDSYAAGVCASQLASLRFPVSDPLSLLDMRDLGERDLCIVSVSGRTRTNIEVAKMARRTGRAVTVVSSFRDSPLACLADRVIELPFRPAPKSPGMLSFSLTLLALLRMTSPQFRCDFQRALSVAGNPSRSFRVSERGTTFILANWASYGVAVYGSAKVYEVLGSKAQPEELEQFGHMEIFSLTKQDSVNVISGLGSRKAALRLHRQLGEHGFSSSEVRMNRGNISERLFASVFALQLAVLREAKRLGLKRPAFLGSRAALAVSDSVIY